MDKATQTMFNVLDRTSKAIKGIDAGHLSDSDFDATGRCYSVTVTDTSAVRTMIKRLPGLFTVYLNGTDGWSIDVTRKALLDLLYCDNARCGMGLASDGQRADVVIYKNHTNITFRYAG